LGGGQTRQINPGLGASSAKLRTGANMPNEILKLYALQSGGITLQKRARHASAGKMQRMQLQVVEQYQKLRVMRVR